MTAPNIVNVTTITGLTTFITITGTATTSLISNGSTSNKVLKINSIIASNTDTATNFEVGLRIFDNQSIGSGSYVSIASSVSVPAKSSLVLISKDTSIYLEENRALGVRASAGNKIHVTCSYEEIS